MALNLLFAAAVALASSFAIPCVVDIIFVAFEAAAAALVEIYITDVVLVTIVH